MKSFSHIKLKNTTNLNKVFSLLILVCLLPLAGYAENISNDEGYSGSATNAEAAADVLLTKIASGASPVIVTAADLVTKVYGALDVNGSKAETIKHAGKHLHMLPEEEENNLWLDSDKGYCVCYSGMTPQVSAVAQFDEEGENINSFGYFFMFPYSAGCREEANRNQCAFCSSLLQEMYDMGSIVGIPVDEEDAVSEDLFSALGSYEGHHINVALREQTQPDASGRFLLVLEITPNVYNLYDAVVAER